MRHRCVYSSLQKKRTRLTFTGKTLAVSKDNGALGVDIRVTWCFASFLIVNC